jgi:hypothetical protein
MTTIKTYKKSTRAAVMLAIILLILANTQIIAHASSATDFGLTLTVSTDKTEYAVGDAVKITYMARNDSDYDMVNVRLTFTMPAELSAPVTVVDIPIIPAHTTYGPFTLPDATVIDTNIPSDSSDSGSSDSPDPISQPTVTATADSPKTGEASQIIWLAVLVCGAAAAAVLVYYCLKKRSKLGTWIVALLLTIEAVTFFTFPPVQAEADEYGLEVNHSLILDGKNLSISMSCKWSFLIADENGNPVTSLTKIYGDPDFRLQTLNGMGEGAITWESSDPSAVSVTNDGTSFTTVSILKSTGQNPVTISATKVASGIYKEMKTSVPITVNPAQLVVTNNSVPESVDFGDVLTPTAKLATSDKAVHVTWASSDESILKISDDGTQITAVGSGTATITGSADYCIPVTIVVTVDSEQTDDPTQLVVTNNSVPTSVSYGVVLTPTAGIAGGDNTVNGVIWTSSNESILDIRVDANGVYTIHAVGTGVATITGSADNYTPITVQVTVNPAQLVVTGGVPESVSYGDVLTPTAGIADSDIDVNVTWSSGNESILDISDDGTQITAVGLGTTTITGSAANCSSVTVQVTVYAQLEVTSNSVPTSLTYGDELTPTARIANSDIAVTNLVWSIEAEDEDVLEIILVNDVYKINAIGVGTATITATADNCIQLSIGVTVNPAPLQLSLDTGFIEDVLGGRFVGNTLWDQETQTIDSIQMEFYLDEQGNQFPIKLAGWIERFGDDAADFGLSNVYAYVESFDDLPLMYDSVREIWIIDEGSLVADDYELELLVNIDLANYEVVYGNMIIIVERD